MDYSLPYYSEFVILWYDYDAGFGNFKALFVFLGVEPDFGAFRNVYVFIYNSASYSRISADIAIVHYYRIGYISIAVDPYVKTEYRPFDETSRDDSAVGN